MISDYVVCPFGGCIRVLATHSAARCHSSQTGWMMMTYHSNVGNDTFCLTDWIDVINGHISLLYGITHTCLIKLTIRTGLVYAALRKSHDALGSSLPFFPTFPYSLCIIMSNYFFFLCRYPRLTDKMLAEPYVCPVLPQLIRFQ